MPKNCRVINTPIRLFIITITLAAFRVFLRFPPSPRLRRTKRFTIRSFSVGWPVLTYPKVRCAPVLENHENHLSVTRF
ncbi:MAG: hypothetical protein EB059_01380 [Alphaproteobacteria bacterium]|nr:hypothetical protein [Alphaproteobacteria bacterium]